MGRVRGEEGEELASRREEILWPECKILRIIKNKNHFQIFKFSIELWIT